MGGLSGSYCPATVMTSSPGMRPALLAHLSGWTCTTLMPSNLRGSVSVICANFFSHVFFEWHQHQHRKIMPMIV